MLKLEYGMSMFDQENAILSESGVETSIESESEIPDEFNTSNDFHMLRQPMPKPRPRAHNPATASVEDFIRFTPKQIPAATRLKFSRSPMGSI